MSLKSILAKPLASYIAARHLRTAHNGGNVQRRVLKTIVEKAQNTLFGKDHDFKNIKTYDDFKQRVPIRDYEQLTPYIDRVVAGEASILWPGRPLYFAKTSGTTSGTKYIPITKDSVSNHINGARDALLCYIRASGNSRFLNGKLIFLSGSPELDRKNGIYTGRLSGIVNHHVPAYLRRNQLPSYETNCIEDWEAKLDKIIDETLSEDMTLISGIPPWVQMYFDRIEARTGRKMKDVFPNFSLFVYGGVNFEPYKAKLYESIGKKIDSVELYPASEGFIAFQDRQPDAHHTSEPLGMLPLLDSGIFFEFIPADEYFSENPRRLTVDQTEVGVNYALIINSNAGLWGYSIGDTVKFVSKDPPRLVVTGRIKHFISAFGEHVIGEEVEKAMKYAMSRHPETEVTEFTVAPQVAPAEGLPHHEWLVEFAAEPRDREAFIQDLDDELRRLNSYYDDLVSGSILSRLRLTALPGGAFIDYMKTLGKLGGQNKVPRLSNDRKIAEGLYGTGSE